MRLVHAARISFVFNKEPMAGEIARYRIETWDKQLVTYTGGRCFAPPVGSDPVQALDIVATTQHVWVMHELFGDLVRIYEITENGSTDAWMIKTGPYDAIWQREESTTWGAAPETSGPYKDKWRRRHEIRTRHMEEPGAPWLPVYVRDTYHDAKDDWWIAEVLDPDGAALATTREFDNGGVLWQKNPDGSWFWKTLDNITDPSEPGPLDEYTTYAYHPPGGAGAGQLMSVTNPENEVTNYSYTARAELKRVWGAATPVEYGYDSFGDRTDMYTWRLGGTTVTETTPTTAEGDNTSWTFDPGSGVLVEKVYADSEKTQYSYTLEGVLKSRTWAREHSSQPVVTTYGYFGDDVGDLRTGQLKSVSYTPSGVGVDLAYTYDRLYRMQTVTDAAGSRTLAYNNLANGVATETFAGGLFDGLVLTRDYDATHNRFAGTQVGSSADPDAHYAATYGYDPANGRLNHVTGPGLPTGGAVHGAYYQYLAGSNSVDQVQFKDNDVILMQTDWDLEDHRNLVAKVRNEWYPGHQTHAVLLSEYAYKNDAAGRRDTRAHSGLAFSVEHFEDYGYNVRSELTSSDRWLGEPNIPGADENEDYTYDYDNIGNRRTAARSSGDPTPTETDSTYAANALNQYDDLVVEVDSSFSFRKWYDYDEDGNPVASTFVGDMNCDGVVNFGDTDPFVMALLYPSQYEAAYPDCDILHGDINGDGVVNFGDMDGYVALITGGGSPFTAETFVYDGENRLIEYRPTTPGASDVKVTFAYDHQGRRLRKQVFTYSGGDWTPTADLRFVYDGWRPILELDGQNSNAVLRRWTWGLDLAGLSKGAAGFSPRGAGALEGAGGIGGLLAVSDADDPCNPSDVAGDFAFCYDGNGNIGQVVDWSADPNADPNLALVARYEYAPYGNVVESTGDYADENPLRFSTKYWDDETGLGYWGYRYYDPRLGRWLNRDPLNELWLAIALSRSAEPQVIRSGGPNPRHISSDYVYTGNVPISDIDGLGLENFNSCNVGNQRNGCTGG